VQGAFVGVIGYGIGMGMAALVETVMSLTITTIPPVFYMLWQIPAGTAIAVALIMIATTFVSLHRVWVLEPAAVFR
jgi:putative ABC transport system permease protein